MNLKAIIKWNKEKVFINPVFYPWRTGIEFKTLTGYSSFSIFTNKADNYEFPLKTKIVLIFVKMWYWVKEWLFIYIRYNIPRKIKNAFNKKNSFPF